MTDERSLNHSVWECKYLHCLIENVTERRSCLK